MDPSLPLPSSATRDPSATCPQIRSRVTVVCAECKRLKLKCDRNAPCGSCKKRDTVVRCIYSPAAAEKVDLHSLNNRLIHVETFLALITAGQTPHAFTSTYPLSCPPNFFGNSTHSGRSTSSEASGPLLPSHFMSSFTSTNSHVHQHHHHPAVSGLASDSIALSEHDVASIFLEDLDLGVSCHPSSSSTLHSSSSYPSNSDLGYIKLEPSPIDVELGFGNLNRSTDANPIVIDIDNAHTRARVHTSNRSEFTSRAPSLPPSTGFRSEFKYSHFQCEETQYQPPQPLPQRHCPLSPTPTPTLPALSIYYPATSIPPPGLSSVPIPGYAFHHRSSRPTDSSTSTIFSINRPKPYNILPTKPPQKPQVTPALLALLPPFVACKRLFGSAREVLKVRPVVLGPTLPSSPWKSTDDGGCTGWSAFERRCLILLARGGDWGEGDSVREKESKFEPDQIEMEQEWNAKEREKEKARRSREIYFAGLQEPAQQVGHPQYHHKPQHQSPTRSQDSDTCDIYIGGDPEGDDMGRERGQHQVKEESDEPSLTFFATMCAVLAVGASALESSPFSLSHRDYSNASQESPCESSAAGPTTPSLSPSPSSSVIGPASAFEGPPSPSPVFFYALSQQALGVWDTDVSSSSGNGERERGGNKDREGMDYVLACVLGVRYLMSRIRLASAPEGLQREKGKGDTEGVVYALVGKMVNVARAMGLGRDDPTSIGGPSNLGPGRPRRALDGQTNEWELGREEWRRMLWWEVMFCDLFTADVLGLQPHVSASSYNTKLPACSEFTSLSGSAGQHQPQEQGDTEEEDDADSASLTLSVDMTISPRNDGLLIQQPEETLLDPTYHYLGVQYRLVQLAQRIKNRIAHPDCCCGYTLDQAAALEGDVRRWQSDDLPPSSLLDADREQDANLAVVQAQSCERTLMANLLVLKVYSPFLRRISSSTSAILSSPAAQASVTAARAILRTAKTLHSVTNSTSVLPVMLDFYPLDKLTFDAFVVCAHAMLTVSSSPSFGAHGSMPMEDITSAVNILTESGGVYFRRGAVVDALYQRLVSQDASTGHSTHMLKRKFDQVDLAAGFEGDRSSTRAAGGSATALTSSFDFSSDSDDQLQHNHDGLLVGHNASPSVPAPTLRSLTPTTSSPGNSARNTLQRSEPQEQKAKSASASAPEPGKEQVKGKDRKRSKKPYPAVGIRVRPGKDPLAVVRSRAQAASTQPLLTSAPRPLPSVDGMLASQQPQKQKLRAMSAASASTTSSAADSSDSASIHDLNRSRSSSLSHVRTELAQHSQYADNSNMGLQDMEYPPTFSAPLRQGVFKVHTIQRKQFDISELTSQQPQQLPPDPSSFAPQEIYDHGQSHLTYSQTQSTYDVRNALSADTMDYNVHSSSFSNTRPPSSTSNSCFTSTSTGHPPTPVFGPRYAVPPVFGPQPPTASPTIPTAYNPQFKGTSYSDSSISASSFINHPQHPQNMSIGEMAMDQIPKPHVQQQATMYDVKPTMENHAHHLPQQEHQQFQQAMGSSFYEDQDMSGQPHSFPTGMAAAPPWNPPNEQQERSTQSPARFWGSGHNLRF